MNRTSLQDDILVRQHTKKLTLTDVYTAEDGHVRLDYSVNAKAMDTRSQTLLGKTILVSNQQTWDNDQGDAILAACRYCAFAGWTFLSVFALTG